MNLEKLMSLKQNLVFASLIVILSMGVCMGAKFDTTAKHNSWERFACEGFDKDVSGIIFEPADPPCCGVPVLFHPFVFMIGPISLGLR